MKVSETASQLVDAKSQRQAIPSRRKFWELDVARGAAVVIMVVYHLMYDLHYFGVNDAIFTNPFWFYFQRVTASTFILLVGVSLTLRYRQLAARYGSAPFLPFLRRGLTLFG